MLRLTFSHAPNYFQFYLRDPGVRERAGAAQAAALTRDGFSADGSEIAIRTLSEYSDVAIMVEYDSAGFGPPELSKWDHVVECAIEAKHGKLVLEGCTDAAPFGEIDLPAGRYRVRIYFGGQFSGEIDGSTEDFYLLQIWPSEDLAVRVLHGATPWPRPQQPWER